jgi:hypothetical protein
LSDAFDRPNNLAVLADPMTPFIPGAWAPRSRATGRPMRTRFRRRAGAQCPRAGCTAWVPIRCMASRGGSAPTSIHRGSCGPARLCPGTIRRRWPSTSHRRTGPQSSAQAGRPRCTTPRRHTFLHWSLFGTRGRTVCTGCGGGSPRRRAPATTGRGPGAARLHGLRRNAERSLGRRPMRSGRRAWRWLRENRRGQDAVPPAKCPNSGRSGRNIWCKCGRILMTRSAGVGRIGREEWRGMAPKRAMAPEGRRGKRRAGLWHSTSS